MTNNITAPQRYQLRRYKADDVNGILQVFRANLEEEWTKYHNAQYLPNALQYVKRVTESEDSDLLQIQQAYFDKGGYFWVLVDTETDSICGTLGLEKISDTTGELRRMCLLPSLRRTGWGTKMFGVLRDFAINEAGLQCIVCSTPEHGEDVLQFYNKLGFYDTEKREPIHNSPIQEVFLEWKK